MPRGGMSSVPQPGSERYLGTRYEVHECAILIPLGNSGPLAPILPVHIMNDRRLPLGTPFGQHRPEDSADNTPLAASQSISRAVLVQDNPGFRRYLLCSIGA
jgi:hypothetical protein